MTALFVVVPLALFVSFAAVWAFVWSVRHGQLDDLDTPALRMLQEDDKRPPSFKNGGSDGVDEGRRTE